MKSFSKYFFTFLLFTSLLPGISFAQQTASFSGLDIAKSVLPFLEQVPQKDDKLIYLQNCEGDTCQFAQDAFKQTRAWVVLAYVGLYNATNEKAYLDKAKAQMEKLLKNCDPNDPECLYIGVQGEALYRLTGDQKYLKYLENLDPGYVSQPSRVLQGMLNAIYARELVLAYKHKLFDDLVAIYKAFYLVQLHLNEAPTLLRSNGVELKQTACWTYLANTEFYNVLNGIDEQKTIAKDMTAGKLKSLLFLKPQKVQTATFREFFDNFDFASFANENKDIYAVNLTELEPCAEALLNYYDATKEEKYKQKAVALLSYIVDRHWDSATSKKYDGDNAFVAQGCRSAQDGVACYKNLKILTDNAYAVYLFSRVKNESFGAASKAVTYYQDPNKDPGLVKQLSPLERFLIQNIEAIIIIVSGIAIIAIIFIVRRLMKKQAKQF